MATFAFIDASNLFYGGEKSLGWKVDYEKLANYLKVKYGVSRILYFGGVEIGSFNYDYLQSDTVPLNQLEKYMRQPAQKVLPKSITVGHTLINRNLKRIRFYLELQQLGYELHLKPVKTRRQEHGIAQRKANCDVDLTFYLMREAREYEKAVVLSGDGDFLPVLKHLKKIGKEVTILSRAPRTAKEIRKFAGDDFRDFTHLENLVKTIKN